MEALLLLLKDQWLKTVKPERIRNELQLNRKQTREITRNNVNQRVRSPGLSIPLARSHIRP